MFTITTIGDTKLINNVLNRLQYIMDKSMNTYLNLVSIDLDYKYRSMVLNRSDLIFGVPLSSSHIKQYIDDFNMMDDRNKSKYLLIIPSINKDICEDDQVLLYNVSMMNSYINYCMHYDAGFILDTVIRYFSMKKRGLIENDK